LTKENFVITNHKHIFSDTVSLFHSKKYHTTVDLKTFRTD